MPKPPVGVVVAFEAGAEAEAVGVEQAGAMLEAGLLLLTQALPFQDHHRQRLFS